MATNDLCTELQRDVKIDVNMVSGPLRVAR